MTIWGGNNIDLPIVENLDTLIEMCVSELASDIQITDYVSSNGMTTNMPEGTLTVLSAKLSTSFPFQGNRLVKHTYDKASNKTFLRYWPAVITYRRQMNVEDLENLTGDQLIYTKSYIFAKMAEKEINILKTVNMEVDNGTLNLEYLDKFRQTAYDRYQNLKESIFIYSSM